MTVEPILNIKTSGFVPSAKSSKYLELLSIGGGDDHGRWIRMKMCDVIEN